MNILFLFLFHNLLYNITHFFFVIILLSHPIETLRYGKRIMLSFIPNSSIIFNNKPDLGLYHDYKLQSRDSRISYLAEERFYKMITDKYSQVDQLIDKHKDPNDKLQLRLNFLQCTSNLKLSDMLKRNSNQKYHQLSVIADMKRRTPTHNPTCDNNILSYSDPGEVGLNMASTGFDVIFVNTDEANYGGHINDLHNTFLKLRKLGRRERPAIVAQAAESRADGVILNSAILGNALQELFNICVNMGIEPIVEVHNTSDALRSVDIGFNIVMINQWDRIKNILYPTRALEIKESIPEHVTTIAAGGIMTMNQVHQLALAGFDAICFGRRLVYQDIPEFIKQVKNWKGPPKPILRMSKNQFFDYNETEDGKINIKLKDNHLSLLNEMNYFYFGKGSDISITNELEEINNNNKEYKIDYNKMLTEEQKSREITINIGTPTKENSTVKVNDLTRTIEGQDENFDCCIHEHNRRVELFKLKWFVEKKKWLKENINKYDNEKDASDAYDLKKAIEMYNHYRYKAKPRLINILTKEEIEKTESELLKNVKNKYEAAPKVNGKVKLDFDGIDIQ